MGKLKDRVAIVTGAGSGIGEVCALRLAREGAKVVVADIAEDGARRVAAAIAAEGGDAIAIHVDIAEEASVAALAREVVARWGRIDILHNNAAATTGEQFLRDAGIGDMDVAIWDRAFAVNTRGTMLMIKHAIPAMLAAAGGSIINMSSGASLAGDFYAPAYAASKAAVNTLTQYVATQYGKRGIRCNTISPGLILTAAAEASKARPDQFAIIEDNTLVPLLGRPEDIAGLVVFLASDEARFITAQVLRADGGYTAHMPHTSSLQAAFDASPARRPGG